MFLLKGKLNMHLLKASSLLLFLVASCNDIYYENRQSYIDKEQDTLKKEEISNLRYYKDTRTNICFAVGFVYYDHVFTTVPCSDSVEKLLK